MRKGAKSKRRITECAAELFWERGYGACGMGDIVASSGLPKGSVYHHFRGKADIALAVIELYDEAILEPLRERAAGCADDAWRSFCDAICGHLHDVVREHGSLGCPYVVLGSELAASEPQVARRCLKSLEGLRRLFAEVLAASGLGAPEARRLSEKALAIYEGHAILLRVTGDTAHLDVMRDDLASLIDARTHAQSARAGASTMSNPLL